MSRTIMKCPSVKTTCRSKRPLIAVDVCNTIADVDGVLKKVLGPRPDPLSYGRPGVTEEFFENNLWVFSRAPVLPGSLEGVRLLAQIGDIIYLTARPEPALETTREWLGRNGFPAAPVVCLKNKKRDAQRLGVSLAVDDAPLEIESLSEVCPVLVPVKEYNSGYAGRCKNPFLAAYNLALGR